MPRGHGPRLKARKDTADYENRLRTVARMAIRKITEEEIARALGVDQATISRDIDEIQRRNLKDMREKYPAPRDNQMELLAEMDAHFKEIERELWDEADHGKGPSRVNALRGLRELWVDRINFLLRLGLISTRSSNVEPANYDEFLSHIESRKKERENST